MNNTFNSQQKSVILQINNYHDEHRILTIRIKLNRFSGIGMVKMVSTLRFQQVPLPGIHQIYVPL